MRSTSLQPKLPPALEIPAELSLALVDAAVKSIAAAAKEFRRTRRQKRGETLKPGIDTPLWNELAAAVRAQLTSHGQKARLARVLRLPRQRMQDILKTGHQMPDAERTLLLLVWLHARRHGHDLA